MEKYEETRDTGRAWLGQIPKHWKMLRMKNVFEVVSERNHPDAEVLSLYREYGVLPKSSRDDNHNVTSEDTASYKFVRVDDLVINKMKAWQGSLGISQYEGIVSPAYYVCRFINEDVSKHYYHYLLRSRTYAQEFERLSTGMRVGQWDLGIDDFMSVPALVPPLDEQEAIAAYLDDQVSQIDSIIAEAQASIEEYKQWKASVIFEAVTKGTNPNAQMKDSGSIWVGRMPCIWKKLPLKRVVINREGGAWGDDPTGGENDRVCMRVADFDFDYGVFKHLSSESYTQRSYATAQIERLSLKEGDILVEKSGGGEKTPVGRAVLYDLDMPALFANFMDKLTIDKTMIVPEFFEYYWQAMYYLAITRIYIKQTTGIQNLSIASLLEKEMIIFPSIDEQLSIVKYLNEYSAAVRELISEKESLISDLESYKRSLIYEAVTGKRRVNG